MIKHEAINAIVRPASRDAQMRAGIQVELEHRPTYEWLRKYLLQNDGDLPSLRDFAAHIAADHLNEYGDYYTRLGKVIDDVPAVK